MIDIVEQYLNKRGWDYEIETTDDGVQSFSITFKMENATYQTFFNIDQNLHHFWITSYPDIIIPETCRLDVCELITRINYRLFLSKFEMNMDEGKLSVVSVSINPPTHYLIAAMLDAVLNVLDTHYPAIINVYKNHLSPKEALKKIDKPQIPNTTLNVVDVIH